MSNYLPDLIEGTFNLIVAGVFIAIFFIPKYPKLHKKKWLLLGAICLIGLGGSGIYKGINSYSKQRIPTKAELESSISQKGDFALNGIIYSSTDGYNILVPEGFTYSDQNGAVSLAAFKALDQETRVALIVMKHTDTKSLDQLISDILKLNPNGKTYYFDKDQKGQNLRTGTIESQSDGVHVEAAFALIKNGTSIYQVMLSTKKSHFEQIKPLFKKILDSFEAV